MNGPVPRRWSILLVAALLTVGCAPPVDAACRLDLIEEGTALSTDEIARTTEGGAIDASISMFAHGGKRYWILPVVHLAKGTATVTHVVTEGDANDPDRRRLGAWSERDFFGDAPGMKWVTNTYQDKDGVLAFVHTEYAGPGQFFGATIVGKDGKPKTLRGPGHSRIGLAWYAKPDPERKAPQFRYLGHIVAPFDEQRFEAWNVHGTPYVIRREGGEDWFYLYFFDTPQQGRQGHIAAARAKVADVLRDAKAGRTGPWEKYDNGVWTPALSGPSSPVTGEHTIAHSDAARGRDGRYFLATTAMNNFRNRDNPSAIVVYG
jgi:hypothetical protein